MYDSLFELISSFIWTALAYVGTSLGGQRMAKKVGMENPWLFWIPGANLYALGQLADIQASRCEGKTTNFRKKILIWLIAPMIVSIAWAIILVIWLIAAVNKGILNDTGIVSLDMTGDASMVGLSFALLLGFIALFVAYIILIVIYYKALYRAYKLYAPDSAGGFLVLSIFIGAAIPILLFALSFKEPALPAEQNDGWDSPFYTL